MPNVLCNRAMLVLLVLRLRRVEAMRVELAQKSEFCGGGMLRRFDVRVEDELETGAILYLVACDARMQRNHVHATCFSVESEDAEIGHDAVHAAGWQAAVAAGRVAAQISGARDEIDALDEAAFFVLHRDN